MNPPFNKKQIQKIVQRRLRNRRFWRDSSLLMLANIVGIGLGLIRTPAMTWLLPKDQVGMIGVFASWQSFLVFLTWPSSLSAAAYHYVAKGQPAAFKVMVKQQLRTSLFSILGFLASAIYWWWQGNTILAILFVIGGLTYPAAVVLGACAGMLGAQENFVALFFYRIGRHLARFSGFVFLLLSRWLFKPVITFFGVNQIALALLNGSVTVWLLWQLRQAHTPPMPPEDEKEMLRYGKHLTGITAIGVLQSRTDQILISAFMPLEVMADYSIALLFQAQLKQLWKVYLSVRYPPLVRLPVQRRRRRIMVEGGILWLGFIGIVIVLSALSYWVIPIILPPSYTSSIHYIIGLLATFSVGVPGFLAEVYFRTEQDERSQYLLRSTAAIFSVALPMLLIFPFGAYGVIVGRLCGNVGLSILGGWLFWHKQKDGINR